VSIVDIPLLAAKEAIAFFRKKGFRVGFDWRDVWQEEHVRAFTVAKAMSVSLLEEIRSAIDDALEQGESLEEFTKQLRPKLQKRGWWGRRPMVDPATGQHVSAQLGSDRRLKTIYQVNMRSAYQAGRWQRIQQTKAAFPFLRYVSIMDGKERPEHHDWHGTILPVGHVWWKTHYGPCGWGCRCGAQPLNARMMARRGWTVTEAPIAFPHEPYLNKRTGEVTHVERGIDPGFSFNVGEAYLDTLTPAPLPESFGSDGEVSASAGATVEAAIGGFLAAFGLESGGEKIFLDRDGWPLAISAGWFRGADGVLRLPLGRPTREVPALVGGAIAEPDSIAWAWVLDKTRRACLMRRYRRGAVEVDVGGIGWRFRIGGAVAAAYDPAQRRDERGRWARGLRGFAMAAAVSRDSQTLHVIGPVDNAAEILRRTGETVTGFTRAINAQEIRHSLKSHGIGSPAARKGRRVLKPEHFGLIPQILRSTTDIVAQGNAADGAGRRLRYRGTINGKRVTVIERISRSRKQVWIKTMYWED